MPYGKAHISLYLKMIFNNSTKKFFGDLPITRRMLPLDKLISVCVSEKGSSPQNINVYQYRHKFHIFQVVKSCTQKARLF